jgi:hypothetical protein
VTNTGIDDERVLRQFSIGNTFFKESLEEKRRFPCNFAEGEYFGYRENSRWIGDTGVKENIEMVRVELITSSIACDLTLVLSSTFTRTSQLGKISESIA